MQKTTLPHLDMRTTQICIIRGKYCAVWGTLYLDKYGEEDVPFLRQKALYLQEDRWELLNKQWMSSTYDSVASHWAPLKKINL